VPDNHPSGATVPNLGNAARVVRPPSAASAFSFPEDINSRIHIIPLYDHVNDDASDTPDGLGTYLYFPIFDATYDNGSEGLNYHIRAIASFFVRKPTGNPGLDDISCRPTNPPTATPPPAPTPTATSVSGGGNNLKWFIRGKAVRFFDNTSSGRIGDIIHAFGRTIVLDR